MTVPPELGPRVAFTRSKLQRELDRRAYKRSRASYIPILYSLAIDEDS